MSMKKICVLFLTGTFCRFYASLDKYDEVAATQYFAANLRGEAE